MKYLNELKDLGLPENEYAIFGSGPLAIRSLRENLDIDIVVSENLWNNLIDKYGLSGRGVCIGNVDVYRDWFGMDIDDLIKNSEIIEGFRYVCLNDVVKWKENTSRDKDKKDLILIRDYLKNN